MIIKLFYLDVIGHIFRHLILTVGNHHKGCHKTAILVSLMQLIVKHDSCSHYVIFCWIHFLTVVAVEHIFMQTGLKDFIKGTLAVYREIGYTSHYMNRTNSYKFIMKLWSELIDLKHQRNILDSIEVTCIYSPKCTAVSFLFYSLLVKHVTFQFPHIIATNSTKMKNILCLNKICTEYT